MIDPDADTAITIAPADPTAPEAAPILERHLAFTRSASPPGTCFAFDAAQLSAQGMTFWLARRGGDALGCAALARRADGLCELKSMHVLDSARGAGVGRALVTHVIATARREGFERIGLETGRSPGFAASRTLYERLGFQACPAFAPYRDDTFSYCMIQTL